jgi:uncharacterized protein YodC (DUF2158 family)
MEQKTIKVGDVVELRSGNSERMTVAAVLEGNVRCFWWSITGPRDAWFPLVILAVVPISKY